ncbi:DUF5067 domain-containing protein [Microbacterium azadirachtae]|uniref:DUF5067 domain-containing protein n=1 Tax=Microbacterium azadirachtae TaxID=582680 RepID=A0A0F0LSA2_9MICO|nr:DUF5067 domain-containing protein [Microbacterium azadirachtae]KJL34381.1 hypothetical protein RS86_00867 [Microbacterium azadirachtae]
MTLKKKLGVAALAATLMLTGCSGAAATSTQPKPNETAVVEAPKTDMAVTTFKDKTLTTKDVVIKITDVKTIPVGEKGNEYGETPVIAFWYNTTNVSGREMDAMEWLVLFSAYQDNDPNVENELRVGLLPDDAFRQSQTAKIKKGGTVQNAVAYKLSDTTTPVKLVAATGLGSNEIGSMTFELK